MKISSFSVSFLLSLGTAVSKKTTGLRGLMQEFEAECLHHFNELDVDKDNVLSTKDLKAVIDYMVDKIGADENEVRTFAHDLSDADYNNDGQIDKQEFMIACEGQNHAEKKTQLKSALKENTWEKAKKDLALKLAQKHEANANKSKMDFKSIGQKDKGTRLAHFAQEGECEDMVDEYLPDADTNGDGQLSYEEEFESLVSSGFNDTEAEATLEFLGLSPGESFTRAEMIALCKQLNSNTTEAPIEEQMVFSKNVVKKAAKEAKMGTGLAHFAQEGECEDMVDEYLPDADTNGNGQLSYEEEFESLVSSGFNNTEAEATLEFLGLSPGESFTRAEMIALCEQLNSNTTEAPIEEQMVFSKNVVKKAAKEAKMGTGLAHFAQEGECEDMVDEYLPDADTNGDGQLSYEEEFESLVSSGFNNTEAEATLEFLGLSPGESFTRAEMIALCEQLNSNTTEAPIEEQMVFSKNVVKKAAKEAKMGTGLAHFAQEGECEDMVDEYLPDADTNGDGQLSYEEEFESLVSSGFNDTEAEATLEFLGLSPGESFTRAEMIALCEQLNSNTTEAPIEEQMVFSKNVVKKAAKEAKMGTGLAHFAQEGECGWVDEFIAELDADGDGAVSYEEEFEILLISGYNETEAKANLEAYGTSPGDVKTRADLIANCEEYGLTEEQAKEILESYGVGPALKECVGWIDEYISRLDTDGDGELSYEEVLEDLLSNGMTEAEAEEMLEPYGFSPDEVQSRAALIAYCEALPASSKKVIKKKSAKEEAAALKECAGLFERMDVDQDGELSLQDLETVVDSKVKNNVDKSQLREFVDAMADLDLNNDEIIDNGEFMSACMND